MKDEGKTKEQLIEELVELRQQVVDLETAETTWKEAEGRLRDSEETFRDVAERSPNMIFINKKGRIVYVNEKCEEVTGYKKEEFYLPDFNFLSLVAPESMDLVKASFGKHMKGEDVGPYDYKLLTRDGEKLDVILAAKLIRYEGEYAILGTVTDISQRKQAEEALQESEERMRSLISSMDDLVFTMDRDGVFTQYYQPKVSPSLYIPPEKFVGKYYKDVMPPHVTKLLDDARTRLADTGEVQEFDYPLSTTDGDLWFSAKVSMRRDTANGLVGYTVVVRDITQRVQAEWELREYQARLEELVEERAAKLTKANEELQREIAERKQAEEALQKTAIELEEKARELEEANKELKEATTQLVQSEKMRALGDLTAGMAHELNQPLNGIKIICQSLLRDKERDRLEVEDLGQDLSDVVVQVNKMAEIIDHMRIYTRHPEGVPMKKIDMKTVIESPFKLLGQQLRNHNIEVTKELSPDLPVMGDSIRLEQVFLNLITNARHAVESNGSESKKIELRAYKDDSRKAVVAEVLDNGAGVPEDLRGKIFQPFFTTKDPGEGTGLGLSVASKIIEEHKGKTELESQMGEGTAFRVILPVAE